MYYKILISKRKAAQLLNIVLFPKQSVFFFYELWIWVDEKNTLEYLRFEDELENGTLK